MPVIRRAKTKKYTPLGVVFAFLGLALFSYFVWKAGIGDILGGIKRLGAGFLVIVAIAGVRKVVRALAWSQCFESTSTLTFREALGAVLAADSLGTIMPLGMVVSEPAKAALVRDKAPLMEGLSAIAVENVFYSLSVALFIFSGMTVMLFSFPLVKPLRIISLAALTGTVVILVVTYFAVRNHWRFLSRAVDILLVRGIGKQLLRDRQEGIRILEDRVYGFYSQHRSRFLYIVLLEACFHLAGVLEAYTTLMFISGAASSTLLAAFILESVNRIITVVFKFIPLRLGVDEWGSGSVTKMLNLGMPSGVTLAVIRKGRDLFWTGIGIVLLIHRGISPTKVAAESELGVGAKALPGESGM
jgi:hypothetical protein